MPALGADMTAGTLVEWRHQVGDRVARGDIIADVETEKGIIEIEVFTDGVIERLLVEPGQKVPVGTTMAILGAGAREEGTATPPEGAGVPPPVEAATPAPAVSSQSVEPLPVAPPSAHTPGATPSARRLAREEGVDTASLTGTGRHGTITVEDVRRAAQRATRETTPTPPAGMNALASPLARRRARELGIELTSVRASSPDGVIHVRDVEATAAATPPPAATDPHAAMRRAIAAAMQRSKREIPHYYLSHTIDLEPALAQLEAQNRERSVTERLLPGVLFLRAVARAVRAVPELNGSFVEGLHRAAERVHLGVAIHLRQGGLVAPAIHDADQLALPELMNAFTDLVARARKGTLRSSEMSDPTITITSLGERGVETVFPIIVPPQVAIVGFGKIVERPWVVDGRVAPRRVVTATLGADHRVSDGHRGGLFLAALAEHLEQPEKP